MLASANYKCRQSRFRPRSPRAAGFGEEFELMLSDLMMAGMDGIGLLKGPRNVIPDIAGRDGYRGA